jgi:hypothetical protein
VKRTPSFTVSIHGEPVWRLPVRGGPAIRDLKQARRAAARAIPPRLHFVMTVARDAR